jgi:hypothetical protein
MLIPDTPRIQYNGREESMQAFRDALSEQIHQLTGMKPRFA